MPREAQHSTNMQGSQLLWPHLPVLRKAARLVGLGRVAGGCLLELGAGCFVAASPFLWLPVAATFLEGRLVFLGLGGGGAEGGNGGQARPLSKKKKN